MSQTIYALCAYGLHVCGIDRDEENFVTEANIRARSAAEARRWFAIAKVEFAAVAGEPCELVVDLCEGPNEQPEDFPMTRQMLVRLLERFDPEHATNSLVETKVETVENVHGPFTAAES